MPRSLPLLLAIALTLTACGQAPIGASTGLRARPAGIAARTLPENDLALLIDLGEEAKKTQREVQEAYIALGLNTAAGRKITPAREPVIREGLAPLLAKLNERIAGWVTKLEADGRYDEVAKELSSRRPTLGDALPEDASAADMLYRLAQYRLKLGVLIEFAVRRGAVADD